MTHSIAHRHIDNLVEIFAMAVEPQNMFDNRIYRTTLKLSILETANSLSVPPETVLEEIDEKLKSRMHPSDRAAVLEKLRSLF